MPIPTIPTRAERRAAFAKALQTQKPYPLAGWDPSAGQIIRAAVDAVLGYELSPATCRLRAEFLVLAKAIEGND